MVNRRLLHSVVLGGIGAILLTGCSAHGPVIVQLHENLAREKLIWEPGRERVGCVSALAFHPNNRQIVVGDGTLGTISVWTIAAMSPDQIIGSGSGTVLSVAVSADGGFLAWSLLPSQGAGKTTNTFPESQVRLKNLGTGETMSVAAGASEHARVRFSPTSDFLAIDTLKELRVIDARSGNSLLSYPASNGPGGPIEFYERDGALSLLGWKRRWNLTANNASLQSDPPILETPGAVVLGRDLAFFIKGPTFANESFWLSPGLVLSSGGIGVGPIDGSCYDTFLKFPGQGDIFPLQLGYIPGAANGRGKLVATIESGSHNHRDVVLIDLTTRQYHSLLLPDWPRGREVEYVCSISQSGSLVAVGCSKGLAIWELRENQRGQDGQDSIEVNQTP